MNTFGRIMEKYGEDTVIETSGKTVSAKTFVQPAVKSGSVHHTPLGKVSVGEYYWFAPAELDLDFGENTTVTTCDGVFEVVRCEKYRALGKDSHWEGILRKRV